MLPIQLFPLIIGIKMDKYKQNINRTLCFTPEVMKQIQENYKKENQGD